MMLSIGTATRYYATATGGSVACSLISSFLGHRTVVVYYLQRASGPNSILPTLGSSTLMILIQ
jgi:hypothetical protein